MKRSVMLSVTGVLLVSGTVVSPVAYAQSQQVTLTIYDNGSQDQNFRQFVQKDIIEQFEARHPNIKIVYDFMKDPTIVQKQQLSAGGGPDVVIMNGPSENQLYAKAGWLLPLDNYAKKYHWTSRYYPWALQTEYQKGHLYGLPVEFETVGLYYNKDMFKKYHWSVPTNWSQFVSLLHSIQSKGIMPIAWANSDCVMCNEWWLSELMSAGLGKEKYREVINGKIPWNSPEVVNAFNKFLYIWRNGWINNKQTSAETINDALTLFRNQKAAMTLNGTWQVNDFIQNPPSFHWGEFPMPGWEKGVPPLLPIGIGTTVGINAHTPHPDEAAEFIDWYYNRQHTEQQMTFGNFAPEKGLDLSHVKLNPHIVDQYKMLTTAIKKGNIGYTAWTYYAPDVDVYLWQNLESVEFGTLSLKDYLTKAEQIQQQDKEKGLTLTLKR
ncbi:MAG: extracellular solute-binding protein [Alicyclobacillus sp.]|nr:extracellular solute-binding protein [Alicyclobacillus sp.]